MDYETVRMSNTSQLGAFRNFYENFMCWDFFQEDLLREFVSSFEASSEALGSATLVGHQGIWRAIQWERITKVRFGLALVIPGLHSLTVRSQRKEFWRKLSSSITVRTVGDLTVWFVGNVEEIRPPAKSNKSRLVKTCIYF